jgi:hypothetical protein
MAFIEFVRTAVRNPARHFPNKTDERVHDGAIFPLKSAKSPLGKGSQIKG